MLICQELIFVEISPGCMFKTLLGWFLCKFLRREKKFMKNENANISSYFCHTNMCIPTYSTTAGDLLKSKSKYYQLNIELKLYKQTVYLVAYFIISQKSSYVSKCLVYSHFCEIISSYSQFMIRI